MKRLVLALAAAFVLVSPALLVSQGLAQQTEQAEVSQQLGDNVRPTRYELTVTPNARAMTLAGQVNIELQVAQATREIVLHALELTISRATLDGRAPTEIRFQESDQTVHLMFPRDVAAGRHVLAMTYAGKINRQAVGMFATDYEAQNGRQDRMLVTQFEASDARRFLPCFDEPKFRAVFDVTVVAPANRVVISNMPQASSQNAAGGMKRVRFRPSPSMPSYLLFVGVGDFERVTTQAAGIEINVWAKRGSAEKGRFALEAAAQVLPYYNEYFGTAYPLPKLDIIAAPGNSPVFAAMENWGAILFFEEYSLVDPQITSEARRQFIYTTVAHEIAHMWFGDLVTMAWWDDLWLNEGFASWMENKPTTQFHPEWNIWMQTQAQTQAAMLLDARTTTHPIVVPINNVDQANEAFDFITYQKGAAVVRMFEAYVGEEAFRTGVRAYVGARAYGNARTTDLWDAVQQASPGVPFRQVADDFTRQPGVPLIDVTAARCAGGRQTIDLVQREFTATPTQRAPLTWHSPVTIRPLTGTGGDRGLTDDRHTLGITLLDCGPFIVNPDQVSYYRVRYPRAQFDRLAHDFAHVPAADQLGLLYDARALGQSGMSPASDIFALARQTPRDADPLVWTLIAGEVSTVSGLYGEDPRGQRFTTFAREMLRPVFEQVGWRPTAGESDNASILRAQLIRTLSVIAEPRFEAEALAAYRGNTIHGSVRAAALSAVGAAATPAVFDDLLARARASTDSLEKQLYYEALAATRDPALAQRAMDLALLPEMPTGEGARLIQIVSGEHPQLAVNFVAAHQSELTAIVDIVSARAFLPSMATTSNDPAMLQRVRTYIETLPAGSRRTSEARYVQLQERLASRARRLDEISRWLGSSRSR